MQTGQKVNAPLGIGTIASQMGDGKVQVLYSKRNFTPEEWLKISPGGGLFVFKECKVEELTEAV